MDKVVKALLLDDKKAIDFFNKVETIEEKQFVALLMIRNNLKAIQGWMTFLGILVIIGLLFTLFG